MDGLFLRPAPMEPIVVQQLSPARRSLRLAVVTETYPPEVNGVANTLARFVAGLCERNHHIQLIRPRQEVQQQAAQGGGLRELLTGGVPIPRYPNLKLGLPARRALIKQWTLQRPDLVHIVTEGPLGWSALQAATKLKLPVSSDFRTNFHNYSLHYGIGWLKKPIVAYLRKFHNRTLVTMVPTEQMRAELGAIGFRNLRVVARGVDTDLFHPGRRSDVLRRAWGAAGTTLVVLYVGRLAAEKNLANLAGAFAAIRSQRPDARLVLVGDGPEQRALRAQIPDAVFAGLQRGEDLAAHYASGDLFLFPSLSETFGNVTIEALASGLPVVAYDYAAAAEHLRHGINGYLSGYGQATDLERHAVEAAGLHRARPDRFLEMGRQARRTAEALDWKSVVGEFESLLLSLAGQA